MENILKVSSKSSPNSVAGAIAGVLRANGNVEIQVIGAGSLNQAIKAIAIARGFVAPSGVDLAFVPAFQEISINNQERTAIKLIVGPRKRSILIECLYRM
ncbi:stage V sporulation protein S [Bacillus toyonensis]